MAGFESFSVEDKHTNTSPGDQNHLWQSAHGESARNPEKSWQAPQGPYNGPVRDYHGRPMGLDRWGNWFPLTPDPIDQTGNMQALSPQYNRPHNREIIFGIQTAPRPINSYDSSTCIYGAEQQRPVGPTVDIPTLEIGVPARWDHKTRFPVQSTEAQIYKYERNGIVQVNTDKGSGTGFFLTPDGEVATDYHVISDAAPGSVSVKTADGRVIPAHIDLSSPSEDVALLKVDGQKGETFQALPLSHTPIRAGDKVIALGHSNGWENIYMSVGNFAGVWHVTPYDFVTGDPRRPYLGMSIHTEKGNSGGPIFNRSGEVVALDDRGTGIYETWSTPSDTIGRMLSFLQAHRYLNSSQASLPMRPENSWQPGAN
jgi:S1-C subfamily serine protease